MNVNAGIKRVFTAKSQEGGFCDLQLQKKYLSQLASVPFDVGIYFERASRPLSQPKRLTAPLGKRGAAYVHIALSLAGTVRLPVRYASPARRRRAPLHQLGVRYASKALALNLRSPSFRIGWCGQHRQSPRTNFHSIRRSGGVLVLLTRSKRTRPPAAMSGGK